MSANPEAEHAYPSDAQSGYVLKAYREHLMSPDGSFLDEVWPKVRRVIGYMIFHDGATRGVEPNGVLEDFDELLVLLLLERFAKRCDRVVIVPLNLRQRDAHSDRGNLLQPRDGLTVDQRLELLAQPQRRCIKRDVLGYQPDRR